jgi:hypothetical protein
MMKRRSFKPTALAPLEERITLSHAAVAPHVVAHAMTINATAHGTMTTTSPPKGQVGGSQKASLTGTSTLPRVGAVHLTGQLTSNGSLPPQFAKTTGTITLTLTSKKTPGSMTVSVTGPATNLAAKSGTEHLTFTVKSATGALSAYVGQHGTATLTFHTMPKPKPHANISTGPFTLTTSINVG